MSLKGTDPEQTTNLASDSPVSRRKFLAAAGASAGAASLSGCTLLGGGSKTFTVGGVWALSQGWGTWGKMMKQTIEYSIEQVNKNDGINGQEAEFILEDSKIDPTTAAEKTRKLIDKDGANVILGPNASSTRTAMSDVLKEKEVPGQYFLYYEGSKAPDYCNPWLFKYGGVPRGTVVPNAKRMMDEFGKSVYLLGSDYVWPKATHEFVKDGFKNNGGEVVGSTYVQIGTTDFSSIIPKIEDTDPDIVWAVLTSGSALAFQQQSANQGVRDKWGEIHHSLTPLTLKDADPEAVEGVYASHEYFPTVQNQPNKDLINGIKQKYGDDALLDITTGAGKVVIDSLAQAVETAGGTSPKDIRAGLRKFQKDDTPLGPVSMGPDHQLKTSYMLGQVNSEPAYEVVSTSDPIAPKDACSDI